MSPILRRGTGRHRKTWWGRWRRRKKMPSSFPLVGMGIAVLIGITIMGFLLSPGGPANSPTKKAPYSATPSQEGSDADQVRPGTGGSPDPTTSSSSGLIGGLLGGILG